MTGEEVASLKREVSLLALLPPDSRPRRTASNRWLCRCPFHEDDRASLSVSRVEWGWCFRCFACGVTGDVVRYVMLAEQLMFRDALQRLASRVRVEGPPRQMASKGRIIIPCDLRGCTALLAVDARDLPWLADRGSTRDGRQGHGWRFIGGGPGEGSTYCPRCVGLIRRGRFRVTVDDDRRVVARKAIVALIDDFIRERHANNQKERPCQRRREQTSAS